MLSAVKWNSLLRETETGIKETLISAIFVDLKAYVQYDISHMQRLLSSVQLDS